MFEIKDMADFRRGWEVLRIFNNPEFRVQHHYTDELDKHIVLLKTALRAYANRETATNVGLGFMVERRIVKEYGIDGYVELVSIPEVFDSESSAEEFFHDFLERECHPSQYDCTGQAFTSWYKLFKRNGRFHVYHSICFDV